MFNFKKSIRNRMNTFERSLVEWEMYYYFWRDRLYDMTYSCIKWENFMLDNEPTTILLPEKWLCEKGMCAVIQDPIMGFVCLPCVGEGYLDVYGQPSSYQCYGNNGYVVTGLVNGRDCVVIKNNPLGSPEHNKIELFAKRLANSMSTGDLNLDTHKTPIMILCDDEQRLTMEEVIEEYMGWNRVIFGNKSLNNAEIKSMRLDAEYIVDKITENTQIVWNEWLNYLGVPGQIIQKKERMLKDEVTQKMGGALASRVPRNAMREKAVDALKKIFGWKGVNFSYAIDRTPLPEYLSEGGRDDEGYADIDGNDFADDRENE